MPQPPENTQDDELNLGLCTRQLVEEYFGYLSDDNHARNLHKFIIEQVEKPLIETVLKHTRGNKLKTARMLGINRNTLHKKIQYYQIK